MMTASVKLGRIWNIPIGLHWSWFIVFALVTSGLALALFPRNHPGLTGEAYLLLGVATSLLFFASVLLHELGHTWVALRFKVPVREINLFIFGGVAMMTKEPPSAKAEFWIAIAGPLVSLALAFIFGALWLASGDFVYIAAPAVWLAGINLSLAIFNMIPGFPLDGGRVLRAIVWHFKGSLYKATKVASTSGQFFALALIAFGVYTLLTGNFVSGLWIGFIGWFLLSSASAAMAHTNLEQRLSGATVGEIMHRRLQFVDANLTLQELVDNHLLRGQSRFFFVRSENAPLGLITLTDVTKIPRVNWRRVTVGEAMTPGSKVVFIAPESGLLAALQIMGEKNIAQVPVVGGGRLLGAVTREAVFHQINLRTKLDIGGEEIEKREAAAREIAPRLERPLPGT